MMTSARLTLATAVDLDQFMGAWYVLSHVPARIERDAYDAVETYRRADDGTIETTYTFRRGGFDGPEKTLRARGYVLDSGSNAEWRMQFMWPFRAEYLIAYVDDAYDYTIIARRKRDLAWIMGRTSEVSPEREMELVARLERMGYDAGRLRRVPHRDRA